MLKTTRCFCLMAVSALLCLAAGCVERYIIIDSRPQGARVFYNGEDKGITPCKFKFYFYGQAEIKVVGTDCVIDGKTVPLGLSKEIVDLKMPWYEMPVLDFFSELVVPFTIKDEHNLGIVVLKPREAIDEKTLMEMGNKAMKKLTEPVPSNDNQ